MAAHFVVATHQKYLTNEYPKPNFSWRKRENISSVFFLKLWYWKHFSAIFFYLNLSSQILVYDSRHLTLKIDTIATVGRTKLTGASLTKVFYSRLIFTYN